MSAALAADATEAEQMDPSGLSQANMTALVDKLRRALPAKLEIDVMYGEDGRLHLPTKVAVTVHLTIPELMALGVDVRVAGLGPWRRAKPDMPPTGSQVG